MKVLSQPCEISPKEKRNLNSCKKVKFEKKTSIDV